MTYVLDIISVAVAVLTALYTLYIMFVWPPGRDPRPVAPVLALAVAFCFLKLPPLIGWPNTFGRTLDYAWACWYTVVFLEFLLVIHVIGRQRNRCGPGSANAERQGRGSR